MQIKKVVSTNAISMFKTTYLFSYSVLINMGRKAEVSLHLQNGKKLKQRCAALLFSHVFFTVDSSYVSVFPKYSFINDF